MVYFFLIYKLKKHFKPCFFILKALKDILNSWIRGFVFLMSRFEYQRSIVFGVKGEAIKKLTEIWVRFCIGWKRPDYLKIWYNMKNSALKTYWNLSAVLYRLRAALLLFRTCSETYLALNDSTIALAVWSISFWAKPKKNNE